MGLRVFADESREVRYDTVDRSVGVLSHGSPDARMYPYPSAIHGDSDERLNRPVSWRDPGRRNRANAADGDLVLFRPTYGTDLREPLYVNAVRKAHYHWPAVVQRRGSPVAVPGMRIP